MKHKLSTRKNKKTFRMTGRRSARIAMIAWHSAHLSELSSIELQVPVGQTISALLNFYIRKISQILPMKVINYIR